MSLSDEQIKPFLDDLLAISRKHGVAISGCGCCGSPYLIEFPAEDLIQYRHHGASYESSLQIVAKLTLPREFEFDNVVYEEPTYI